MNGLSPGTSLSSDAGYDQMMSEPEDPLHENSILQDLFYYNSVRFTSYNNTLHVMSNIFIYWELFS